MGCRQRWQAKETACFSASLIVVAIAAAAREGKRERRLWVS